MVALILGADQGMRAAAGMAGAKAVAAAGAAAAGGSKPAAATPAAKKAAPAATTTTAAAAPGPAQSGKAKGKVTRDQVYVEKFKRIAPSEQKTAESRRPRAG